MINDVRSPMPFMQCNFFRFGPEFIVDRNRTGISISFRSPIPGTPESPKWPEFRPTGNRNFGATLSRSLSSLSSISISSSSQYSLLLRLYFYINFSLGDLIYFPAIISHLFGLHLWILTINLFNVADDEEKCF
jgi:hypothetical protein